MKTSIPRLKSVRWKTGDGRPPQPGNVIILDGLTKIDIPPDRVLTEAIGQMINVVVMGWDLDGEEYFASSMANGADVVWLAERIKRALFKIVEKRLHDHSA